MPPTTSPTTSAAGRLNRIRRWLLVGTIVPFSLLMGAATFEGFWEADKTRATLAIVILVLGSIVVPALMAIVARGILREASSLDLERTEMEQMYGQARRAALLDGLTGLGNHRAFQDELSRLAAPFAPKPNQLWLGGWLRGEQWLREPSQA